MVKNTLHAILKGSKRSLYESSTDSGEEEPLHVDKKKRALEEMSPSDSGDELQNMIPPRGRGARDMIPSQGPIRGGRRQQDANNNKRVDKMSAKGDSTDDNSKGTFVGVNAFVPASKEFNVINHFPNEARRVGYVDRLAAEEGLQIEGDEYYVCGYCQRGDGDEKGMSSEGLKKVYAFENKYMYRMERSQFITCVVDKFNTLVVGENVIRNPEDKIPLLTKAIYARHLKDCVAPWDPLFQIWDRIETWKEEADSIRGGGAKFRRQDGVILKDNNTYKMLIDIEKQLHNYYKTAEVIMAKRTEDREAKNIASKMTRATKGRDVFGK